MATNKIITEKNASNEKRCSFELFKSNVCHQLKTLGDIDFIIHTLETDEISEYYEKKWYAESLYLLARLDYISRINEVPLCNKYNNLRRKTLEKTIYPSSVIMMSAMSGSDEPKRKAIEKSIPEFLRFNIVESEIRDVA